MVFKTIGSGKEMRKQHLSKRRLSIVQRLNCYTLYVKNYTSGRAISTYILGNILYLCLHSYLKNMVRAW